MPQLDQFTYFTQFFWSCLFAGKEKRAVYALVAAVSLALGFLWMDELQQAVAQFYPSTSGGLSGLPPGPSGDSSVFPILERNEPQDPPCPSQGKDYLKELRADTHLEVSFRNFIVTQEEISLKVAEILAKSQRAMEMQEIRAGVESFFPYTSPLQISYRNKKIKKILKDLSTHGEESSYFTQILEAIHDSLY